MASTFKNYITNSIGSNADIYIAPALTTSTVIGITMSNLTGTDIKVSLCLNDGVANAFIVKDATIPGGSALVPVGGDQKLVLEAGNVLYAFANTTAAIDVVVSALELT